MHEQEQPQNQTETEPAEWQIDHLAASLHSEAQPIEDVAYQTGQRITVGDATGKLQVEIYPTAHTVRVTGQSLRIELFRQSPPTITDAGVVFSLGDEASSALALSPSGALQLTHMPAGIIRTPETAQDVSETSEQTLTPPSAESVDLRDPGGVKQPSTTPSPSPEKQERVSISGRIGYAPTFGTTPKGTFKGEFSLAEHTADEATIWHKVVAFQKRAERLRDMQLQRGEPVQVIGYLHESKRPGKAGQPDTSKREIYAVVTKRLAQP